MHFCSSANMWVWSEIMRARGTAACKKYSLLYCLQCSILSSLFQPRTCKRESVPKPSSSSSCLCNVLALFCWAVKKTGLEMQLFSQVLRQALTMSFHSDCLPPIIKMGAGDRATECSAARASRNISCLTIRTRVYGNDLERSQAHSNNQVSISPNHSQNKTCTRCWVHHFSEKGDKQAGNKDWCPTNLQTVPLTSGDDQDLRTGVGEGTKGEEGRKRWERQAAVCSLDSPSSLSKSPEHFNNSKFMHEIKWAGANAMTFLCYKQNSRVGVQKEDPCIPRIHRAQVQRGMWGTMRCYRHLLPKATHAGEETTLTAGQLKPLCTVKQEDDLESILVSAAIHMRGEQGGVAAFTSIWQLTDHWRNEHLGGYHARDHTVEWLERSGDRCSETLLPTALKSEANQ